MNFKETVTYCRSKRFLKFKTLKGLPRGNETGSFCYIVAEFSSAVIYGSVPSELGGLAKETSKQSTGDMCSCFYCL